MTSQTYDALYDHGRLEWVGADRPVALRAWVRVIIVEPLDAIPDPSDWRRGALTAFERAFGPDEPEYTGADVKFR